MGRATRPRKSGAKAPAPEGARRRPAVKGPSGANSTTLGEPSTASLRRSAPAGLEVHLDSWLREFGPPSVETVGADSVEHLLDVLEQRYPRLRFKLRDETGELRRYVRVFVDGEDVSGTTGVSTSLAGARAIDILHSIAGG